MRRELAQTDTDRPVTPGSSRPDWEAVLRRGLAALACGDFDDAERQLAHAHALAPDRAETCYALGRERMRRQRFDDAEALLAAAWSRDDSLLSAAATLARCLGLHLGRFDDAFAVLAQAAARHPDSGVVHVVRAELYLAQDRYDDARDAAQAAFSRPESGSRAEPDRDSVRAAACAALARVHNRDGIEAVDRDERDMALFLFKRAAHLDPTWSSPLVNMGAVLVGMGKLDRARKAYRDAIRAEPENAIAHFNHGLLLRGAGEAEAALEALHRAAELEPELAEPAVALAEMYIDRDEPTSAARALARAVEHHPDSADLWARLGHALAEAGRRADAEASLRQALDIAPGHSRACAYLADLLAREGRYIEAAALARRAQASAELDHPGKRP